MFDPNPLTADQAHALLRFLGAPRGSSIVMAPPGAHYVRIPGRAALALAGACTLPGRRTVRYARQAGTVFVADVGGPAQA